MRTALLALATSAHAACATPGPAPFAPPNPEVAARNRIAGDPHLGRFPFEAAVEGLPRPSADARLHADLHTSEGRVSCELWADHAPIAVANFVGLARGLRPYQLEEGGPWETGVFYDGLPWHRVVPGQIIQTGKLGSRPSPGFRLQDEVSPGDDWTRPGVLATANAGERNTGSAQFFITMGKATHLKGKHTIFGACDDEGIVRALAGKVERGEVVQLDRVEIVWR